LISLTIKNRDLSINPPASSPKSTCSAARDVALALLARLFFPYFHLFCGEFLLLGPPFLFFPCYLCFLLFTEGTWRLPEPWSLIIWLGFLGSPRKRQQGVTWPPLLPFFRRNIPDCQTSCEFHNRRAPSILIFES